MNDTTPEELFEQAVESFPFPNMQPTSHELGDLTADDLGNVEYCKEFTFDGGTLGAERIEGGGWIELYIEDNTIEITSGMQFALAGDWKNRMLLPEGERLQGWYDLQTKQWTLEIGLY